MNNNQTNQNPFAMFGTPARVIVNGKEISRNQTDIAVRVFAKLVGAVKGYRITRIDGVVKLYISTYTVAERAKMYNNRYGIDVERYCTRHACMDCDYFNHVYMTEINRNCPLLKAKDNALENGYAEIAIDLLTEAAQ